MPTQADDSGDADLHSTMKAYIAERYSKPGAVYLGLVHRLDRPVGGLVVLAKTSKAADRLSAQVRDKTMHRQYVAAVRGTAKESAELCDFLLKDGKTNMVRVVPANTPGAKDAKLRYQKCGEAGELTLVRVRLFTAEAIKSACSFLMPVYRSGATRVMAVADPANRSPSGVRIWG